MRNWFCPAIWQFECEKKKLKENELMKNSGKVQIHFNFGKQLDFGLN